MRKTLLAIPSIILSFSLFFCGCGTSHSSTTTSVSSTPSTVVSGPSVFDAGANISKTESSKNQNSSNGASSNMSSNPNSSTNSSSKPVSSVTNAKPQQTPEKERLVISCWGDSLTEGMRMTGGKDYPSVLNKLLGDGYQVLNGGDGGEDTITIMARQGGVKIFTSDKITFQKGETLAYIGNGNGNGFETADGKVIRLTAALGRNMPINDVTIDSKKYKIILKNFDWSDRSCEVYLERSTGIDKSLSINKGTEVKLASIDYAKTNYCDIYLIGGNGGYDNDVFTLIEQYKKMIEYRGNENYLVIIPYWTSDTFTQPFIDAFGDKAVDFRAAATNITTLSDLKIGINDLDKTFMTEKNQVPPCLRLENSTSDVHLNEHGYRLMAETLYYRGLKLKYW